MTTHPRSHISAVQKFRQSWYPHKALVIFSSILAKKFELDFGVHIFERLGVKILGWFSVNGTSNWRKKFQLVENSSGAGVSKTRGGGWGRGRVLGLSFFNLILFFFKECYFRVKVRVDTNPNPNPSPAFY